MKTIGIVCEGPRDYDMLTKVISHFSNEEPQFRWLHPTPEFGTDLGSGWKGVFRWCEVYGEYLDSYLNGISPKIDLLVIQMDADVARCEKEIYCPFVDIQCEGQGFQNYLNCEIAKRGNCMQQLPPNTVCDGSPTSRVTLIRQSIQLKLNPFEGRVCVVTVPCDSTESWILAAYEHIDGEIEAIDAPWNVITRTNLYHGVRVRRDKKSKASFSPLIKHVCDEWTVVKEKCPQAKAFQDSIENSLMLSSRD